MVTTVRTYTKIMDVAGDIGGSGELIFISIGILYWVTMCNRGEKHSRESLFKSNQSESFNIYTALS